MDVLQISSTDVIGGAARASYRIHASLNNFSEELNIHSYIRTFNKRTSDDKVLSYRPKGEFFLYPSIQKRINRFQYRKFKEGKTYTHTIACPATGLGKELNGSNYDILNFHFLDNYTISIEEIGLLTKPIVWTLHDMWAFCGAEHYADDSPDARFILGYTPNNMINQLDLNRKTWLRKKKSWNTKMNIVCPSNWMHQCVIKSKLMQDWNSRVIPNPIDSQVWYPVGKEISRCALNLPIDKNIILFGAMGGTHDPRKGADLLEQSIQYLSEHSKSLNSDNTVLLIFGQNKDKNVPRFKFPTFFTGELNDDISLRLIYSAADIMVIPSRQDNLPNTALESLACATPVAAFNIGGLPDMIQHQVTGWLADPYDIVDLANGIEWVLINNERHDILSASSRQVAIDRYHPQIIAGKYSELYYEVMEDTNRLK